MKRPQVLVSWSSGKDSAWMLSRLQLDPSIDVVGLLTTINETHNRVAMHGVRREIVEAQAAAAGLPITFVPLPWPCPNGIYEERFGVAVEEARLNGITNVAFGDLFLEDIRDYRVAQLEGTGVEPMFPIWCGQDQTSKLASEMVDAGIRAVVTCLDPTRVDRSFAGRTFDAKLLSDLPPTVDACAENGEFHTVCTHAPCFDRPIDVRVRETVEREGYVFAEVYLATN